MPWWDELEDEGRLGWSSLPGTVLSQVEQTVTGLPAIATRAVNDPLGLGADVAKGFAHQVAETAPLWQAIGAQATFQFDDVSKYLSQYKQNLLEDPLGQGLLFTTAGVGSVARTGAVRTARQAAREGKLVSPGRRQMISSEQGFGLSPTRGEYARALALGWNPKSSRTGLPRETLTARLGKDIEGVGVQGTPIVTRTLPRNYYRAERAKQVNAFLKSKIPPHTWLLGEYSKAARALRRGGRVPYLALMSLPAYYEMDRTWRSMSKAEKVASRIHNYFPLREDLDAYVEQIGDHGTIEAEQTRRVLTNERYLKLYEDPTDKMRKYNQLGHELDRERQKILIDVGAVTPDAEGNVPEFIASPYRATRIVRGAQYLTDSRAYRFLRKTDADLRTLQKEKGKLVSSAERFGQTDLREQAQIAREAARVMDQESGFRARVHGGRQPVGDELREGLPASTDLEHLQNLTDEAGDEVTRLRQQRDMLGEGQLDTNTIFDMFDMPASQRRFGHGAAAIAEDIHASILREEEARLAELLDTKARADNGTISQREMAEWGVTTPTDIRQPTAAELVEARDLRLEADRIADRVKQRKRYRLKDDEVARLRTKIDGLREAARKLENPRPINRRPATLAARAGGRYASVSKKVDKEIKRQQESVDVARSWKLPDEAAPMENLRNTALRAIETKYRHAAQRYERLLTTEHALGRSTERSARAAERAQGSKAETSRLREARIDYIAAQRARFADLLEHQRDLLALRDEIESSRGQLMGGGDPDLLRAEIARAGRMQPFYSPDVLQGQDQPRFSLATGSIRAPRKQADIYPSRSILLRRGLINLGVEAIGPAYFAAAKHALNVQMHAQAMQMATKVSRTAGLPTGGKWEYLRRTPGEAIGPIEKGKQAHMDVIRSEYDRGDDLTTTDSSDPEINFSDANGREYRLIVPKVFANEFRQENRKASKFQRYFLERPMDVWRTLLLHLRVPWLINNIVGNSFLYAVRFAGVGGLASLIRFYSQDPKTRKFIPRMRELAKYKLSKKDMRHVFPEQERGTFLETSITGETPQLPERVRNKLPILDRLDESTVARSLVKAGQWGVTAFPRADKYVENALRRKATNRILRSSDEVQDAFRQMILQGESPTFREAVDKAMAGDPNFRDYVSTEVNQALGDFLSLSKVERSWIRQTVPFYAWMREISRISARLLVDHPGRVLMLQQMAQAASEIRAQEIPGYLQGTILTEKAGWIGKLAEALPRGTPTPGLESAIAAHGMSPYGSVADIVRGLRATVPGANEFQRREFLGNLNPIFGAFVEAFGKPEGEQSYGLLGDTFEGFTRSIPHVQAAFPYPNYLYPDRTRKDLLWKILGDPRVRYDPDEAAYQESVGR